MRRSLFSVCIALLTLSPGLSSAIEPMSRQAIVDMGKPAVGYSYWWGHGRFRTDGTDHGSCSGSCPGCSHSGQHGGDCSGFVAKAWQVPNPIPLDDDDHPYSTWHFVNQSNHWSHLPRDQAQMADAFVYNTDGAGHIFLFEGGDPWGYVNAYECKGCSYGCVYGNRKADSKYELIRRNQIAEGCQAHCEGSVIVGADCGMGDCAAYGSSCVDDALGVRCVFAFCPAQGETDVCVDDKTIGHCKNGQLEQGDCSAFAAYCSTAGNTPAHCASAFCVGSPNDIAQERDICFIDGKRLHCDALGGITDKPCEAGTSCTVYPETHCEANLGCPATGGGFVCVDDYIMGECFEGAVGRVTSCAEIESYCSTAGGSAPHCVPKACVAGPGEAPADKTICTPDGQVGHCKPDGSLEVTACPEGQVCDGGVCGMPTGAAGESGAGGAGQGGGAASAGQSGAQAGAVATGGAPTASGGTSASAGATQTVGKAGGSAAQGGKTASAGQSASGEAGSAGKAPRVTTVNLGGGDSQDEGGCSQARGRASSGAWLLLLAALGLARRRR